MGCLSPGIKLNWIERDVSHSLPSGAVVKNSWHCNSTVCVPSSRAEGLNLKSRAVKSSLVHFCVCSTNKIYEIYIGGTKNGIYGLGEADGRDFYIMRHFLFLLGPGRLNSVLK